MKNLIFQYYIPYEMNDRDMGGIEMPEWAKAGCRSAQAYAEHCGAEYLLDHERYFQELDPRLDSNKIIFDDIELIFLIKEGTSENFFPQVDHFF